MAIPEEIRNVERPKNTVVQVSRNGRYLVIKRTSKRVPGKKNPQAYSLGTIGEIIDGKYVEIRKEPRKTIDDIRNNRKGVSRDITLKDYGQVSLAYNVSQDLLKDLLDVFKKEDARKMYSIALIRSTEEDIKCRDIKFAYDTSYLSECLPNVALSKNTISDFLTGIGMEYHLLSEFLTRRAKKFENGKQVIDGTLVDSNGKENSFSEFSRKGRNKGSKDESILYSFDLESKEPVTIKLYSGNVTDTRSVKDLITGFSIKNSLLGTI